MLGQIWIKFKDNGFSGSVSVRDSSGTFFNSDPGYNDRHIHDAILEMDEEYKYVKVIHEGYNGKQDIPSIALVTDAEANHEILDNAILDGLAHRRLFREARTGAIVQFGYDLNEA